MKRGLGYLAPASLGRVHRGVRTAVSDVADGLPRAVDLSHAYPEIFDQGALGSCVAQALAGSVGYLLPRTGAPSERPSRLAIYWEARRRIGQLDTDSGAMIGDGVESLRVEGWGPESAWPYDELTFDLRPPAAVYEAGQRRRLVSAEALDWDPATLRWELTSGHAVVAGLRVYEAFEQVGEDGIIPSPDGECLGGHAVCITGYDADARCFRLRNSWGTGWGQAGYGWIPEAYLVDPLECGELWSLRAVRVLT